MEYVRLSKGFKNYTLIPASENIHDHIADYETDYYKSIFRYSEEQYRDFLKSKTVSGATNVTTNLLYFDFDSKSDIELARRDAIEVIKRLASSGINPDNIEISFTGNKGFSVEVETDQKFNESEFKNVTFGLAADLPTFDKVVNDPQRIVRVAGTKHKVSGLYKLPISLEQLTSMTASDIRAAAKDFNNVIKAEAITSKYSVVELPENITNLKITVQKEKAPTQTVVHDLDLRMKPKWLSDAKYALQEGFFGAGERNLALMILGATYKSQGMSKEIVYRMLKGVAEIQAQRNNTDRYADKEIYNNIIKVIFSDNWKGGNYSYDNTPLLREVTARMGLKPPKEENDGPRTLTNVTPRFKDYVKNIEKNTIKTGIPSLDKKIFLSVGANVGMLGAPGSGKSSLALEILSNTSKAGVRSVFASLDMTSTRIYEKILYRLTGKSRDEIYKTFKDDKELDLVRKIEEEYGNVFFYDKSSPTVADIRSYVEKCNELASSPDERVKLVMIDYFERVSSDMSDDTAASKKVAGELQDLVNDLDIALITLVQPNKMSGDMSSPINSYTSIKGSSFLAQSFRIIMGIYREGFNPRRPEDDKFMTVSVLKNDLGEPCSFDFNWDGKRGKIWEASDEDLADLEKIRQRKAAESIEDL